MSGITGIFNRDGRPVTREMFLRAWNSIAHRGTDGSGAWEQQNIALGHRQLHTTPESLFEKQPLLDNSGEICLVLHGRVDNRVEMKKSLLAQGAYLRGDTDAEIFLQSYLLWGENFPAKIIGDFAVAIWDARKQQLFCARDVWGVKPFYYGLHGQSFIFSSDVRTFFADPTFPCVPNEGFVAEVLANNIVSTEETLYQHVFRLPPAHTLIVDANGLRRRRYWNFDGTKEIRYRTDEQYAEHFLSLFTEVLTQHLRSPRPVGADLSGGLDSSAIVCLAQSLFAQGRLPKNGFETFSLLFPDRKEADESAYINDVIHMWDVNANLLAPVSDTDVFAKSVEFSRYFPSPPNGHMMDSMKAAAQQKGVRVMLTGVGGDEFLTGTPLHCADLLRQGKFLQAWNQAKGYEQIYSSFANALVNYGAIPLLKSSLPERLLRLIRVLRHGNAEPFSFAPMTQDFVERANLRQRLTCKKTTSPFATYAQTDIYEMMQSGWVPFRFEMEERATAMYQMEYRFPLYDRRLAEFCLALPETQRWRGATAKFILRQAMHTILPASILQRTDKGDFTYTFPQCFANLSGQYLLDAQQITQHGWVNHTELAAQYRSMLEQYHQGKSYSVWQLWMIFGIELWATTVFHTIPQNVQASFEPFDFADASSVLGKEKYEPII